MLELAKQYAKSKGTKIIAHKINGDEITFVLESGAKLTMSADQLEAELGALKEEKRKASAPFEYIDAEIQAEVKAIKAETQAKRKGSKPK